MDHARITLAAAVWILSGDWIAGEIGGRKTPPGIWIGIAMAIPIILQ